MKELQPNDTLKSASEYIGFVDLVDRGIDNPVTLTIERIADGTGEKPDGTRALKAGSYILAFKETPKKLIVQGRKRSFLIRTFGAKASGIVGQKVKLYGDPTVKVAGEVVGGTKFVGQQTRQD